MNEGNSCIAGDGDYGILIGAVFGLAQISLLIIGVRSLGGGN